MFQSMTDGPIWEKEFALLVDQEHFEKVWGIMLPNVEQYADSFLTSISNFGNQGVMEYDAFVDGKYVYSFLDNDIARLIRLREALQTGMYSFEVICFPEQYTLLRKYLGPQIDIKTIDIDSVEDAMGQ